MKGSVPYHVWKKNIDLAIQANQIDPQIADSFFRRGEAAPVFRSAARFVRYFADEYTKFTRNLIEACAEVAKYKKYAFPEPVSPLTVLKGAPLMFIDPKNPANVKVFINIPITDTDAESVQDVTDISYVLTLDDFYNTVKTELNDPRRKQAWTPLARGIRRIKRTESMSIGSALRRFSPLLNNKDIPDDIVRDIASYIENASKPFELKYIENAKDYITLYTGGPGSCMVMSREKETLWAPIIKHKIHPCSFFAYFPNTKAAYITRGPNIMARAIIYKTTSGKWQYGRIYASNTNISEEFAKLLKKQDITPVPHPNTTVGSAEWTAPAFETDGRWYTPVPYFDNMPHNNGMGVRFNDKKKEFEFVFPYVGNPKAKGFVNIAMNVTKGFIIHDECTSCPCAQCGIAVTANSPNAVRTVDGHVFCHPNHAVAQEYVRAYRSDGTPVWVRRNTVYTDKSTGNNYTNRQAALDNGCYVCVTPSQLYDLIMDGKNKKWSETDHELRRERMQSSDRQWQLMLKNSRGANEPRAFMVFLGNTSDPKHKVIHGLVTKNPVTDMGKMQEYIKKEESKPAQQSESEKALSMKKAADKAKGKPAWIKEAEAA